MKMMKQRNHYRKEGRRWHCLLALAAFFFFTSSSEERGFFFFFFSSVWMLPLGAGFCTAGLAAVGAKKRLMSCVHTDKHAYVQPNYTELIQITLLSTYWMQIN